MSKNSGHGKAESNKKRHALTPALSHRMGEGEVVPALGLDRNRCGRQGQWL